MPERTSGFLSRFPIPGFRFTAAEARHEQPRAGGDEEPGPHEREPLEEGREIPPARRGGAQGDGEEDQPGGRPALPVPPRGAAEAGHEEEPRGEPAEQRRPAREPRLERRLEQEAGAEPEQDARREK